MCIRFGFGEIVRVVDDGVGDDRSPARIADGDAPTAGEVVEVVEVTAEVSPEIVVVGPHDVSYVLYVLL